MFLKLFPKEYGKSFGAIIFYLSRYRRSFWVLMILSIVSAISNSVVPYLAGRLIDTIALPDTIFSGTALAAPAVLGIVALWFFTKIIADVADRYIALASERLETFIQGEYIARGVGILLEFSLTFHKRRKTGEVFDRIVRAANWLSQVMSRVLIDLTPQFLSVFISLSIMFFINPLLAGILLAAVTLYALVLVRITPRLALVQRKMHRAYDRAYGDAYDVLANVQPVKHAVAEAYEQRKIHKNYFRASRLWISLASVWEKMSFFQRIIVTLTQLAIFLVSIFFIRAGQMSIGELVMFNGYAAMLFGPFVMLGRNWQIIQNGMIAIARASRMLEFPREIYEPPQAIIPPDLTGEIRFDRVSFGYYKDREPTLKDISFSIGGGMVVALVGESGVGKTTLVDLISFYYRPSSGKIFIDGHDIAALDLRSLRSFIAVVPQEIVLFNDTVKNNIKYGKFGASDEEVFYAARLAYADEFIASFPKKYEQVVGERGIKLSTGQKQRIAIARAILRNPRILILDEPTSALDAKSEKYIQESLESLMKGRTTLIIAHRLSTVRKADMILVLEKGRIVERGRHEELIKIQDGVYRKLYELQIGLSP